MSAKIIVGIILGLIVVGGGTYAAVSMKKEGKEASDEKVHADGVTSIQSLIALGVPQKCVFTDETAAAETSGTVYVSGGKVRGDFEATVDGKTYHAHSVMDGEVAYSWVEETKIGVKTAIDTSADTSVSSTQGLDAAKNLNYRCVPWVPDTSVFSVPKDITFMDAPVSGGASGSAGASVGGQVQGSTGAGVSGSAGASVNGSAGMCAQCDMVPEAYRAQCKVAAGC